MKFTKTTLQKIEQIFDEQGYTLRYEKGNFQSGYCLVENRKVVIVNKFLDIEGRINCLLDILSTIIVLEGLLTPKSKQVFRNILKLQSLNNQS